MTGPRPGVREHHWVERGTIKNTVVNRPVLEMSAVSVIVALPARGPRGEANNFRPSVSRGQEEGGSPAVLVAQRVPGLAPLAVLVIAVRVANPLRAAVWRNLQSPQGLPQGSFLHGPLRTVLRSSSPPATLVSAGHAGLRTEESSLSEAYISFHLC